MSTSFRTDRASWEAVEALLDRALDLPPQAQAALIEATRSSDPALAGEVESLIAAALRAGKFLEQPAAVYAAPLLAWTAEQPLDPGTRLGRYEILRRLGRGATATVYLAADEKHHREVAVKVLHHALGETLGAERFLHEIEIAATLHHPHILPLFDSGRAPAPSGDGELLFYVMPHVEGESLRHRLKRGPLPPNEALRIAREVAGALDYSHRRGVVHRDIKPENILLQDGQAIVADFGIARAIDAAGADRAATGGTGTPAYMSPEQRSRDAVVDGRADLYSLGCVLYEMLAGEPAFGGASAEEIGARQAADPSPSLLGSGLDVPAAVVRAVTRAMARDPGDRFASGAELSDALGDASDAAASRTRTSDHRAVGWPWTLAGGALLLALAVLGIRATRAPVEPRLGHRTRLTLDPGLEIDAVLSPDGRRLAYAAGPASQVAIYISPVGRRVPVKLAPAVALPQRLPSWSPDGRRILFRSPRGIELVAADRGDPRVLVPDPGPSPADSGRLQGSTTVLMPGGWAPDGHRFVFARRDSLYVADTSGAPARLVATGIEPHSAVWSPDGRRIAYVTGNRQALETGFFFGNAGRSAIWFVGSDGGPPSRLSPAGTSDTRPAWLPDSRGLLFISDRDGGRDIYAARLGGGQPAPSRLTTGLDPFTISLSADGRHLAYAVLTESSNIWTLPIPPVGPVSSAEARAVTSGSQVIEGLDVSPDGRWLAFDSDRSGTPGIYRVSLEGGEPERLTSRSSTDFGPLWSPDGRQIAFHSVSNGARHVFVMSDLGRDRVQVTRGTGDDRGPVWLADGQILYRTQIKDQEEVRVVSPGHDGQWAEPRTILRGDILQVAVSPDAAWLAFATPRGLEVSSAAGTSVRMVVGRDDLPGGQPNYVAWADDGRLIYFLALDLAGRATIWSVAPRGGTPLLLVTFDDPTKEWHRYGFRARHGKFYFTVGDRQSDIWQLDIAGLDGRRP